MGVTRRWGSAVPRFDRGNHRNNLLRSSAGRRRRPVGFDKDMSGRYWSITRPRVRPGFGQAARARWSYSSRRRAIHSSGLGDQSADTVEASLADPGRLAVFGWGLACLHRKAMAATAATSQRGETTRFTVARCTAAVQLIAGAGHESSNYASSTAGRIYGGRCRWDWYPTGPRNAATVENRFRGYRSQPATGCAARLLPPGSARRTPLDRRWARSADARGSGLLHARTRHRRSGSEREQASTNVSPSAAVLRPMPLCVERAFPWRRHAAQ